MRSVALLLFCELLCASLCPAANRKVTVVVSFERPHSEASVVALRHELTNLLEPAGLDVDLRLRSELPAYPEFSELVVFEMKGSCSMKGLPLTLGGLPDERGPLAMTYSSDGQILHFGAVECDRVRECLQRITGPGSPEKHQAAFGTALGIVMAHELYHMIAGLKTHTKGGLTKKNLSPRELLYGELSVPSVVGESLRRNLAARP
jgi:hypothetical protein